MFWGQCGIKDLCKQQGLSEGSGLSPIPPFASDIHVSTYCVESTSAELLFHEGIREASFYHHHQIFSLVLTEQSLLNCLSDNSNICVIAESADAWLCVFRLLFLLAF